MNIPDRIDSLKIVASLLKYFLQILDSCLIWRAMERQLEGTSCAQSSRSSLLTVGQRMMNEHSTTAL